MTTLSAGTKVLIFAALIAIAGCGELRSREDFVASIQDKSTTEVQATIGKPIAIDESAPDTIRWTYKSKTFSTESGTKFDKKTVVVFRKGEGSAPAKMVDVVYE